MAEGEVRVFLDANILYSASLPDSRLATFLKHLGRHAEMISNRYALAETERNLTLKCPESLERLARLVGEIRLVAHAPFDLPIKLPEKDQPILSGAIAGNADYLLTGDRKDFGHLFGKSVAGVGVVTVPLLIDELVKRGLVSEE